MIKIFREYEWHHIALIVDETEASNTLVKLSMQAIFKEAEFGYEIFFDIQSFSRKESNVTIDYKRYLQQASKVARGMAILFSYSICILLNDSHCSYYTCGQW